MSKTKTKPNPNDKFTTEIGKLTEKFERGEINGFEFDRKFRELEKQEGKWNYYLKVNLKKLSLR